MNVFRILLPIFLITATVIGASATAVIVSNIWKSPILTVTSPVQPPTELNLLIASSDFKTDKSVSSGVYFPWTITISNPNTYLSYSYTVTSLNVEVNDTVAKAPVDRALNIGSFQYSLDGVNWNDLTAANTTSVYTITPSSPWVIPASGTPVTVLLRIAFVNDGSYRISVSAQQ